jgi:UDP-3-O-[3-hydroxymyristoyl] glucosamine N-acyltransferase
LAECTILVEHSVKVGLVVHVVQAVLVEHSVKVGLVVHVAQAVLVNVPLKQPEQHEQLNPP